MTAGLSEVPEFIPAAITAQHVDEARRTVRSGMVPGTFAAHDDDTHEDPTNRDAVVALGPSGETLDAWRAVLIGLTFAFAFLALAGGFLILQGGLSYLQDATPGFLTFGVIVLSVVGAGWLVYHLLARRARRRVGS